ncbi:release factor glutamine methyltransferase [Crossiella equi]|uniref:peptide chain release factor N(5)-glutamine methyltransferase n=1 Tax=Crossiella equi TaxID=130796 RepID=A0ABS5A4B0_9PSEU|nr:putative protein N(5)-glutamine methyltransferase [Crossiella equi]MBP2471412.1 release factor glutamine methyltransferase [Crossiella equi]
MSTFTARLRAAGCVFAEEEAGLILSTAATPADAERMVARRVAGEPLEHVLGWAEFHGRRITVDPGVFVPRRRTELLTRQAVALSPPNPVVVDLCCGSGAVAAVLEDLLSPAELHAADVDPAAVRCARRNTKGQVHEGDLYSALPVTLRGHVDLLVANAPYVPTDAIDLMPPEARLHEPLVALDGGPDGLAVHRRIVAGARDWLSPGGHVLIETSRRQAPDLLRGLTEHGLRAREVEDEDLGATVVIGTTE